MIDIIFFTGLFIFSCEMLRIFVFELGLEEEEMNIACGDMKREDAISNALWNKIDVTLYTHTNNM